MLTIENKTPYKANLYTGYNREGNAQRTLVIKATFDFVKTNNQIIDRTDSEITEINQFLSTSSFKKPHRVNEIMPYKEGVEYYIYHNPYRRSEKYNRRYTLKIYSEEKCLYSKSISLSANRFFGMSRNDFRPTLKMQKNYKEFNVAPKNQQLNFRLNGNETIQLEGFKEMREKIKFIIPRIDITTILYHLSLKSKINCVLDTLIINLHQNNFSMIWRAGIKLPEHNTTPGIIVINNSTLFEQ